MLPFKIKVGVYCQNSNSHGTQARGEKWNQETVRGWCVKRIHGVREGYFRLMLYAPSGKCWNFDVYRPLPNNEKEWSA